MSAYILFGGSFDPIHNGHIRIASAASLKLNADVIFIPARSPRWKTPYATAKHRLKMLKLAIKDCPCGTSISKYELDSKNEINYTIDTVKYFRKKYPKDKLYLLIGSDQVNRFSEWKNAEEIAELVEIVFVSRPVTPLNKKIIDLYHMKDLSYFESGDVSSSDFRNMKTIDVPDNVLKYIEEQKLYYFENISELLPEKRYKHCLQVANLAYKIAESNNLSNKYKYYIAGLLHDLGKVQKGDDESTVSFMKKHYKEYLDLPRFAYHQFVGEYMARTIFKLKDEEILNAIKFHCTGNANMSELAMVVYASDKIEPTRDFDSRFLINSCLKNYKKGFIDTLIDNKKYLMTHNKDITNKLTDACFEMYLPRKEILCKKTKL